MVATRNHPRDFDPPPSESPTKRTTRASAEPTATTDSPTKRTTTTTRATQSTSTTTPSYTSPPRTSSLAHYRSTSRTQLATPAWSHTPSNLTLIWLAISLPLVIWDTLYVLLRPHSMPGGSLHKPIWAPYGLYGTIDHVYGFKSWDARNGWTSAQGSVNVIETAAYVGYLWVVYKYGQEEPGVQGRGAPEGLGRLARSRTVYGKVAAGAVMVGYSTAFLTFWKTVLYWLNEAFSGFDNIGHNDWMTLVFMWIVPNGAWLVFPAYMMYVFGQELLQGLELATQTGKKDR